MQEVLAIDRAVGVPDLAPNETRAGQEARFADLVERQMTYAFRVANAILRNPQDAEDAVQEMFLKLHRTRGWEELRDERAFLARAAWRSAIDRLRRRRTEPLEMDVAARDADLGIGGNPGGLSALVHRLIDSLPEELRQPLALSGVEEMSSREIAAVMGIPEGTVRTRLMRARELLRQKLRERMGATP